MSCGCDNSNGSPPDATLKSTSAPAGSGTSYGGPTKILRGSCGPAQCPSPPTVSPDAPDPYKPGWLSKLTASPVGKLVVAIGDYLYLLRSKCSGYLFYNADTENVTVEDAPFVSAAPRETRFGFLAKAVPAQHQVCTDATDDCPTQGRQELAAQIMEQASCGQLVIARPPDCGELAINEAADADKQVRFDFLNPTVLTSKQCPGDAKMLMQRAGKRGKTDCDDWILMSRLRFSKTQWGGIAEDAPLPEGAMLAMLVPADGGTDENPCFELRLSNVPAQKQANAQQIFMLDTPHDLILSINTGLPRYAEMAEKGTKVWAIVSHRVFLTGNTSTGGSWFFLANGLEIGALYLVSGGGFVSMSPNSFVRLTEDKLTLAIQTIGATGSPVFSSPSYKLRGYMIEP